MNLTDGLEYWIYNSQKVFISKRMVANFLEVHRELKTKKKQSFKNVETKETIELKEDEICSCQDDNL